MTSIGRYLDVPPGMSPREWAEMRLHAVQSEIKYMDRCNANVQRNRGARDRKIERSGLITRRKIKEPYPYE